MSEIESEQGSNPSPDGGAVRDEAERVSSFVQYPQSGPKEGASGVWPASTPQSQEAETPKPNMSRVFALGVDGGGSKTLAVLVDGEGKEVGRGIAGSSNYAVVGRERALRSIIEAVAQAKQGAGSSRRIQRAWLGLSGVDRPEDIQALQPYVQDLAEEVQITNDAYLLLGALKGQPGVALISGTGSIALGQDAQGKVLRAGGWGHVFGDEGSGYLLACQALQAVAHAADGRGPQTRLLPEILHAWGLTEVEQLLGEVYKDEEKARIAGLSPCVLHVAWQGDPLALEIVHRGAYELALLVRTISRQLGFQQVRLALGGGLLLHDSRYRQLVLDALQPQYTLEQVVLVEQPALSAARALIAERR